MRLCLFKVDPLVKTIIRDIEESPDNISDRNVAWTEVIQDYRFQEDTNAPLGQKISCPSTVCFHPYSMSCANHPAYRFVFEDTVHRLHSVH